MAADNPINSVPPLSPAESVPAKTDIKTTSTKQNQTTARPEVSQDTVTSLSAAAKAALSRNDVIATDKVNEIMLAISQGKFEVKAEKVAKGLISSVVELLNTKKKKKKPTN